MVDASDVTMKSWIRKIGLGREEDPRAVDARRPIVAELRDDGVLSYVALSREMSTRSAKSSKWDVKRARLQLDRLEGDARTDAGARAEVLRPLIAKLRTDGSTSNAEIARALSQADIPSPRGSWHPSTVRALLARLDKPGTTRVIHQPRSSLGGSSVTMTESPTGHGGLDASAVGPIRGAPKQDQRETISTTSEMLLETRLPAEPSVPNEAGSFLEIVSLDRPKAEPASRRLRTIFGLVILLGLGVVGIYWAGHQTMAPSRVAIIPPIEPAITPVEPMTVSAPAGPIDPLSTPASAELVAPPPSQLVVTSVPIIDQVLPTTDDLPLVLRDPPLVLRNPPQPATEQAPPPMSPTPPPRKAHRAPPAAPSANTGSVLR